MKFDVLSPSEAQVSRMQVRVVEGYENRPKSLWREWLGLLQARPVKNGVLVAMAAALVLFSSPVFALLQAAVKRNQPQVASVVHRPSNPSRIAENTNAASAPESHPRRHRLLRITCRES